MSKAVAGAGDKSKTGKTKPVADNSNHRERVRAKYLKNGGEVLEGYELLEMLLFYCVPRKDTKALAKTLIGEFGSLAGVLEADESELTKFSGVSLNGAVLIKLIVDLSRQYQIDKVSYLNSEIFDTTEKLGEYFKAVFHGYKNEAVYVMFLNQSLRICGFEKIAEGGLNSVNIEITTIIKLALKYNSLAIVMSHNHPTGRLIPSHEDVLVTLDIKKQLRVFGIRLLDHIIVNHESYISMSDGNYMNEFGDDDIF